VKAEGPTEKRLNRLRNILRREVSAPYVIPAPTEISILLQIQRKKGCCEKLLIEPLAVSYEAVARRYLGLPLPAPDGD